MSFAVRPRHIWKLRSRVLELGQQTRLFGIVNATPDSFSGDGLAAVDAAVAHGLRLLDEGADGLDIGGESTRPGSGAGGDGAISTSEEQDRVLPVIESLLRERPGVMLSVDTYRAATARAAVAAGVEIVNDVSGLHWDEAMAAVCAELGCGVILMHTRGRPGEWRHLPPLAPDEVLPLVRTGLADALERAAHGGIEAERIVIDPGYGFGKAGDANYALLAAQAELLAFGRPLLAGLSRKSFLGQTLSRLHAGAVLEPALRDQATAAACVAAVLAGSSLLRVHAVAPARQAAAIADAILAAQA